MNPPKNQFMVGLLGGDTVVALRLGLRISKAEALELAAYLVAVADDADEFPAVLAALRDWRDG